ncbi:MAG: hypothetical protein ABMB14_32220 [Myxococcota bacterium]
MTPAVRARVRAALLAAVIAVHAVAAAPLPHTVTRADLRSPVAQEELATWAARLGMAPEALSERLIAVTGAIGGAHRAALAPFQPLLRLTGTGQGWALFANPDIYPSRLEVRIRRGTDPEFTRLYQRLDPDHAWADDLLRYRRIRGVYDAAGDGGKPRLVYRRFADWLGARILRADPSVTEVEVRMIRTHTTLRGVPPDPTLEVRHAVKVGRP